MSRAILALVVLLSSLTPAAAERIQPMLIGTGAVTGIYFPAAGAVQRLINEANTPFRLAVQSTAGSLANLKALASGDLDMAIAQSDWAYFASKGGNEQFPTGNTDLRVLLGLHSEVLTIVARKDANIASLNDLKGKKVNVGPAASGTRNLMDLLFKSLSWSMADMGTLMDLEPGAQSAALCSGQVDAIVFIVPHPNAAVQEALSRCASTIVPVTGPAVSSLIAGSPFYSATSIPAKLYAEAPQEVPTFGVRALLLTTSRMTDGAATAIMQTVFNNVDKLNAIHPALAKLTKNDLLADKLGIPLHAGAETYLKSEGLVNGTVAKPAQ